MKENTVRIIIELEYEDYISNKDLEQINDYIDKLMENDYQFDVKENTVKESWYSIERGK